MLVALDVAIAAFISATPEQRAAIAPLVSRNFMI
jgi:hypothetical protein